MILVTGASSGIGAALARGFGACGGRVAVHYHQGHAGAQATCQGIEVDGGAARAFQADLFDADQTAALVAEVLAHFGRIDVLVNNAGTMFERSPLHETPDDRYDQVMDLNVRSVFWLCKRVVPVMLSQGRGSIINMSSISARRGGGGGSALYGASKAAVAALTRGLAKELAAHNIRVNALAPGLILTPLHDQYTPPERLQSGIREIPMGRAGTPEECVGAALFLACDTLSSYITGQVIEINGGLLMP